MYKSTRSTLVCLPFLFVLVLATFAEAELPMLPGFERWQLGLSEPDKSGVIYFSPDGLPGEFQENTYTKDSDSKFRMIDLEVIRSPTPSWSLFPISKEKAFAATYVQRKADDPAQHWLGGGNLFYMTDYLPSQKIWRPLDIEIELKGFGDDGQPEFLFDGILVENKGKQFVPSWEFQPPTGYLAFQAWVSGLESQNMRLLDFEICKIGPDVGEVVYCGVAVEQVPKNPNGPQVQTSIEWMYDWFEESELPMFAAMGWHLVDAEVRPSNALDAVMWSHEGVFVRDLEMGTSFDAAVPSLEVWKWDALLPGTRVTDLEHTGGFIEIETAGSADTFQPWFKFYSKGKGGKWASNVLEFSGIEATFMQVVLHEPKKK